MNRRRIARELVGIARELVALVGTMNAFLNPERGQITFSIELPSEIEEDDPDYRIWLKELRDAIRRSAARGFRLGKPQMVYKGGRHWLVLVGKGRPFDEMEMAIALKKFVVTM